MTDSEPKINCVRSLLFSYFRHLQHSSVSSQQSTFPRIIAACNTTRHFTCATRPTPQCLIHF